MVNLYRVQRGKRSEFGMLFVDLARARAVAESHGASWHVRAVFHKRAPDLGDFFDFDEVQKWYKLEEVGT
jgi:hypothetical protein